MPAGTKTPSAPRLIRSYAPPQKGVATRPGMANYAGSHAKHYRGFPRLKRAS